MSTHFFNQNNRCIFCGCSESAVRAGITSSVCVLAGGTAAQGGVQGNIANGAYPVPQPVYPFPTAPQPSIDGFSLPKKEEDPINAQAEEPKEEIDWDAHRRFMKGLDRS